MAAAKELIELSPLLSSQWGMVTTSQAERVGISRVNLKRMADAKLFRRVDHGVYKSNSHDYSVDEVLRACWLRLRPTMTSHERLKCLTEDFFVTGRAALWVRGVGDFVPKPYEFVSKIRYQSNSGAEVKLDSKFDESHVEIFEGIPVVTPTMAIHSVLVELEDLETIENAVLEFKLGQIDFEFLKSNSPIYARKYGYPTSVFRQNFHRLAEMQLERHIQLSFLGMPVWAHGFNQTIEKSLALNLKSFISNSAESEVLER